MHITDKTSKNNLKKTYPKGGYTVFKKEKYWNIPAV
jgi:hypothetical protein